MKTRIYPLLCTLCLLTCFYDTFAQTPLAANGRLKVVNRQLCNESGTPIQLRGISSHGLHWFPACYTSSSIQALARDWGADVFRAAMYVDEGGYRPDSINLRAKVNQLVDWSAQAGMYCIIDWHILNPGDPFVHLDEAKNFFRLMAQQHAGKKNVIYEICNEPHDVDWARIKSYAEQIIPIIRSYDAENIILVGTPNYSGTPGDVRANPLTGTNAYNVMYTFHFYAGSHYTQNYIDDVLKTVPLFISEWGVSNYSGNGGDDYNNSQAWINLLAGGNSSGIKVSWTNWNYADKNESSSALQPNACSTGSWNSTSTSGTWVKSHILNPADNFGTPSPSVSITSPANNSTVTTGSSVTINAAVSNASASKVQFYNGAALLGEDPTAPYSYTITNIQSGPYNLIAKAVTGSTTLSSSTVTITAAAAPANRPPQVSLTAPSVNATYTAPATITLSATASDPDGTISKVDFYNGTSLLATVTGQPYQFTWSNVTAGKYTLSAKATDNAAATAASGSVMVTVNVPNPNPPSGGDITGPDCVNKNDIKVFQVSAANQAGATSYSWWFNGSTQSISPNGASATFNFGPYFTGGQVCAGVNYSGAPYYKQLCKNVPVCSGTAASGSASGTVQHEATAVVYPSTSNYGFTLQADKNILQAEVIDQEGRQYQHIGKQQAGGRTQFGQQLAAGMYLIRISYEDKSMRVIHVLKTK